MSQSNVFYDTVFAREIPQISAESVLIKHFFLDTSESLSRNTNSQNASNRRTNSTSYKKQVGKAAR